MACGAAAPPGAGAAARREFIVVQVPYFVPFPVIYGSFGPLPLPVVGPSACSEQCSQTEAVLEEQNAEDKELPSEVAETSSVGETRLPLPDRDPTAWRLVGGRRAARPCARPLRGSPTPVTAISRYAALLEKLTIDAVALDVVPPCSAATAPCPLGTARRRTSSAPAPRVAAPLPRDSGPPGEPRDVGVAPHRMSSSRTSACMARTAGPDVSHLDHAGHALPVLRRAGCVLALLLALLSGVLAWCIIAARCRVPMLLPQVQVRDVSNTIALDIKPVKPLDDYTKVANEMSVNMESMKAGDPCEEFAIADSNSDGTVSGREFKAYVGLLISDGFVDDPSHEQLRETWLSVKGRHGRIDSGPFCQWLDEMLPQADG